MNFNKYYKYCCNFNLFYLFIIRNIYKFDNLNREMASIALYVISPFLHNNIYNGINFQIFTPTVTQFNKA